MELHIYPTPDETLHSLARFFVARAGAAVAAQGRFSVALSGGSSPRKLYELLASDSYRSQVDWERVFFFFGDERYVPLTDAASNYRMAKIALLDPLHIQPTQVFAVDTSLPPDAAAQAYTRVIQEYFAADEARFDLILLGLGDNSHTASLFPHTSVLQNVSIGAREVYVDELKAFRVTLTAPLINQAHAIAFLVYGADKAAAVEHVLTGEREMQQFPAQMIAPAEGELHWFLDEAAASLLARKPQ